MKKYQNVMFGLDPNIQWVDLRISLRSSEDDEKQKEFVRR